MHRHRFARFAAILIFLAALFYCVLALAAAVWAFRGGPTGWGPGWRGWVLIPTVVSGCFGAVGLLIFGAVVYFLTRIERNLASAARQRAAAAAKPVAAPIIAAGVAATVAAEERLAEAAPQIAPVEAAVELPQPLVEAVVQAPEMVPPAVVAEMSQLTVEATPAEVEVEPWAEVTAPLPELAAEVSPVVEVVAPAISAPAPEVYFPSVEIFEPELEVAAPDEMTALRAQLAALQARLAELEAPPVAVQVPVAPDRLAAELPVKLPVAPEVANRPAATAGRLPGAVEAARIAAEMAALKPAPRHEPASPTLMASVGSLAAETKPPLAGAPADDLLGIKGIGPTYVRRLAEVGITTFAALAAASEESLDEVTIGLPGRAAREEWRGQARQLAG